MSGAPRPESLTRLTDIVVDQVLNQLGTSGTGLGDDYVQRVNQALATPLQVLPQSPATSSVNFGPAVVTLPNGVRLALLDEGAALTLPSGTVNFGAGTISAGSVTTFTMPNVPAGKYIKALIQYRKDSGAVNVTYGANASTIAGAGTPALLDVYVPICIVELHSTAGGIGIVDPIQATNLVQVYGALQSAKGPKIEQQTVTLSSQTLFTLSTITIPSNRAKLRVAVNGLRYYYPEDFSVPSDNTVSFTNSVPTNAEVTFEI